MSLSVYLMVATIAVFWLGTAFALWWSFAAGQWAGLSQAARIVLDDDSAPADHEQEA